MRSMTKHAFRAAGAAHRGDHHLVGEDHADFGVEVGNTVIADRVGLGIQRNGHAVGVISAGIVIEDIFEAQDGAIFFQGDFAVMHLVAFRGGRQEVFTPVFDPFDRALQFHGDPGQQHIIRLRAHDFGSKTAADEGGDHAHLAFSQSQARGQWSRGW